MSDRKVIVEVRVGSHLYGTSRPDSDEDFQGVFLPSQQDLLGMGNAPAEWTKDVKVTEGDRNGKGDVDRKFFSLKKFLFLAMEGQPGQLELLFAPDSMIVSKDPIWDEIVANRHRFLSRKTVAPFVGFAKAQAYKASIKGENLRMIRDLIDFANRASTLNPNGRIRDIYEIDHEQGTRPSMNALGLERGYHLKLESTPNNTYTVEVAGRKYDTGMKFVRFVENLRELEKTYGTRSDTAAANGYDWKSLTHAYRLMFEAVELLSTGTITLPIPDEPSTSPIGKLTWLKEVREGGPVAAGVDHHAALHDLLGRVRSAEDASSLPDEPDWAWAEKFCQETLARHLLGSK